MKGRYVMKISHDDGKVLYMGRYDRDSASTKLYFVGSQAKLRFNGTKLAVNINAKVFWGEVSLGAVIDGKVISVPLLTENNEKDISLTVAEGLENKTHEAIIYKRYSSNYFIAVKGFETDGEFLMPEPFPALKMEVYGDSVCAGEVCEAVDYVGKNDPENHNSIYDNVWHSFVMQTARNIGAQIHNIAQGGIALFDRTGYFHYPETIGLESVYDKTCYFPEAGEITKWDFSRYTPDIVVIAVGQNDQHNPVTKENDRNISDPSYRRKWKDKYIDIVKDLDGHYKNTKFVLTTTVLMHDPDWDNAIEEITSELNGMGIKAYHNMFSRNGAATPGHPRIPEHNEMARELTGFIEKIMK